MTSFLLFLHFRGTIAGVILPSEDLAQGSDGVESGGVYSTDGHDKRDWKQIAEANRDSPNPLLQVWGRDDSSATKSADDSGGYDGRDSEEVADAGEDSSNILDSVGKQDGRVAAYDKRASGEAPGVENIDGGEGDVQVGGGIVDDERAPPLEFADDELRFGDHVLVRGSVWRPKGKGDGKGEGTTSLFGTG